MLEEKKMMAIDDDEADHATLVSGEAKLHISLANEAATLTLDGLGVIGPGMNTNDRKMLIALLLAKSAQNVRFASKGLTLGYYSGAYAALRSAFEGLAYTVLFDSLTGELEVAKWLQTQLSSEPDMEKQQNAQIKDAKKALLEQEKYPHIIKQAMGSFWNNANERIHTTLQGLAKEFGADIPDFIPDELDKRLEDAEGDLEKALALYVMLSKYGKIIGEANSEEDRIGALSLQLSCRFDADVLDDIAAFAFYVAHRLLDTVKETFNVADLDWQGNYKKWHKQLRNS